MRVRSNGPIKRARLAGLSLTVALGGAMVAPTLFSAQAVVPGQNGKIVFTSCRTGASEIWVMNGDGSGQTQLTNTGADAGKDCADGGSREPVWSPDGTKIAFMSYMGATGSSSDIFIMNADGTGRTNLTNFSGFDDEPAWSPDGTKIAFRSNRDVDQVCGDNPATTCAEPELWVMNADGTNPQRLTVHEGVDDEPAWSPDGSKLAIRRCQPGKPPSGGHCSLTVLNAADGSVILDMENAPGFPDGSPAMDDPAWSTDGTLLAFRSYGVGGGPDIHTVKAADATAKTNLSNDPDSNVDPAYSPDGTKVAYVRQPNDQPERSANGEIWVMNADGSGQTQLTTDPDFDGDPDFQRVGGSTATTAPTTATTGPTTVTTGPTTATTAPGTTAKSGYWLLESGGKVHPFGDAAGLADVTTSGTTVDLEPAPNGGYWILEADGRVHPVGGAKDLGGATTLRAGEKATSLSATPTGNGFWVFTSLGRALGFGDAGSYGDMGGTNLNGAILDSIPTSTGKGYYMVGSDGGIFAFGDAEFHGSMGGEKLNAPVQSLVPDPDGEGYWLVASDGGIFAFKAPFRGSMGATKLNKPVTGMVSFGNGYMMVAEDGGIFNFSDRPFSGSLGGTKLAKPIVSVAAVPAF